jgi:membrane-associated phospholipid phosphatase
MLRRGDFGCLICVKGVGLKTVISRRAFWLIGAIFAINLGWLATTRIDLLWMRLIPVSTPLGVYALALWSLRRQARSRPVPDWISGRVYSFVQALMFLNFAWINMRVLNHLVMTTALPFQDDFLARGDADIGFNWLQYFEFVHSQPWLIQLLDRLYSSLTPLSVAAMLALVAMGRLDRAALFLESFFAAAVICVVIGLAFPALGTFVHYGLDLADYPNFSAAPGVFWVEALQRLRVPHGGITLDPLNLPGLAAFPSLHTAAALVLGFSFWRTKAAVPIALYAAGILAATPVFGGHYGVDMLAGGVVAGLVFTAVARLQRSGSPDAEFGFTDEQRLG